MTYFGSEEHEPVTWVRGHAIYATHIVLGVFLITMIVAAILGSLHPAGAWLAFDSSAVLSGQAWRIFTYGLWNPPTLGFAIDMLMLFWFGRELEKFFGRTKFFVLYGGIYLIPPLLFTALGTMFPHQLVGQPGALAIFVAFATLYPNAAIFFALLAKWVALAFVALYTLMALGARSWTTLISLWATTGFAFAFVRHHQGHFNLPSFRLARPKPKLRVLPEIGAKPSDFPSVAPTASMAEVDALLDKIAQSGIGSLTAKERAKLDAARQDLKKRSGSR